MKIRYVLILLFLFFVLAGCSDQSSPMGDNKTVIVMHAFEIVPLKWHNGYSAAVSINYDSTWGKNEKVRKVAELAIEHGLPMDYKMVTAKFNNPAGLELVEEIRNDLIPKGIHFFGHGHEHVLHDNLDFESAYNSFKTCFDLMDSWGLNPIAYAYPGSSVYKPSTQLAVKLAGFICARGTTVQYDSFYICPDNIKEPENWYYLPSVVMGDEYPEYVENHEELKPILETTLAK